MSDCYIQFILLGVAFIFTGVLAYLCFQESKYWENQYKILRADALKQIAINQAQNKTGRN